MMMNHVKGDRMELMVSGAEAGKLIRRSWGVPIRSNLLWKAQAYVEDIASGKRSSDKYERLSWSQDPEDPTPPNNSIYKFSIGPRQVCTLPLPSPSLSPITQPTTPLFERLQQQRLRTTVMQVKINGATTVVAAVFDRLHACLVHEDHGCVYLHIDHLKV